MRQMMWTLANGWQVCASREIGLMITTNIQMNVKLSQHFLAKRFLTLIVAYVTVDMMTANDGT